MGKNILTVRSFWLPVFMSTLVAAGFGAVLARRGRELDVMLARTALLEGKLARLEAENRQLLAERDELLSSPAAIERVAREEYGFAAPGEQVIAIELDSADAVSDLPPPARRSLGMRMLTSRRISVLLPAAVFVVSCVVFAVFNFASAVRQGRFA